MSCRVSVVTVTESKLVVEKDPSINVVHDIKRVVVVQDGPPEVSVVHDTRTVVIHGSGLQGPAGPPGAGSTFTGAAAETIFQFRVVSLNPSGTLYLPNQAVLLDAKAVLGVALNAALTGEPVVVQTDGVLITGPLWNPGSEYFLGAGGILVDTPPTTGQWLQVAFANSATELIIRPQNVITRA